MPKKVPDVFPRPEPKPWERQKGESRKAYAAFCVYRDLPEGERTLAEAARRLGRTRQLLERWSRTKNWVERLTLWEDEQDRLKREAMRETVQAMCERHAKAAAAAIAKVTEKIENLAAEALTVREATQLFDVAVKIERLARGATTDNVQTQLTGRDGAPIQHEHGGIGGFPDADAVAAEYAAAIGRALRRNRAGANADRSGSAAAGDE